MQQISIAMPFKCLEHKHIIGYICHSILWLAFTDDTIQEITQYDAAILYYYTPNLLSKWDRPSSHICRHLVWYHRQMSWYFAAQDLRYWSNRPQYTLHMSVFGVSSFLLIDEYHVFASRDVSWMNRRNRHVYPHVIHVMMCSKVKMTHVQLITVLIFYCGERHCALNINEWLIFGVLGHDSVLYTVYWAGDNLGG